MKLKDYLPLKVVVEDLGVSRWTIWRACGSDIPDFPQPIKVGRQLYWKKNDFDALEAALMRFQGRGAFDRKRRHEKTVKALRTRTATPSRPPAPPTAQGDLFS